MVSLVLLRLWLFSVYGFCFGLFALCFRFSGLVCCVSGLMFVGLRYFVGCCTGGLVVVVLLRVWWWRSFGLWLVG